MNSNKANNTTFKKGDLRAREAGKKKKKVIPVSDRKLLRENINTILDDYLPEIPKLLNRLIEKNPDKALALIINLMEFVLPRLARIEGETESTPQINIIVNAVKEKRLIELKSEIEQAEN